MLHPLFQTAKIQGTNGEHGDKRREQSYGEHGRRPAPGPVLAARIQRRYVGRPGKTRRRHDGRQGHPGSAARPVGPETVRGRVRSNAVHDQIEVISFSTCAGICLMCHFHRL